MTVITKLQHQLDKLDKVRAGILGQKLQAVQRVLVKCVKCHKKSRLGTWSFVQGRWYVEPYSCAGGDYWDYNKTETEFLIAAKGPEFV